MKKYILILVFYSVGLSVTAQQIREFSRDSTVFISQLSDFLGDLKDEEQSDIDRFKRIWDYDSISYQKKQEIIEASNIMLKRRAGAGPFLKYIKLINYQMDPVASDRNLTKWFDAWHQLLKKSTISFNEMSRAQDIALSLIKDSVLYNLAGIVWRAGSDDFQFDEEAGIPIVRFNKVNLSCIANKSTINIFNTVGYYDLINLLWYGSSGNVTWERAGFEPAEVYVELSDYQIEMNRSQYRAENVRFYYKKYFDLPLEGYLEDRAMPVSSSESASFPKFFSYQSIYSIPGLFKGIDFTGGLSMQGAKLVGTGDIKNPARIDIFKADTLTMVIRSQNIVIRENSMNSTGCSMTLFLESDSIFHPDLEFLYMENNDEIRLTKRDVYTSGVPYSNTYHNLNMNFEELLWRRESNLMRFQPSIGRAIGKATFESNRFFNYNFFSELQGRDYIHPLVSLWNFSRSLSGWREFPLTAYSGNIGMPDYQVRHQMMKLSRLGFVYFDEQKDRITLLDKLFYFIEASVGRTDYDVILFESNIRTPGENATLNLGTRDLTINGIPKIFLSDSQNVALIPAHNQIVMKRNKSFRFDGSIQAGLFTLYGSNFFFEYDSFKIDLRDVDSLRVRLKIEDKNKGKLEIINIENLIQNLTGEIAIDDPYNKSGLKNYPEYPIFRSTENSYVYFDDPLIQGGVYNKDEVFFELSPFEIDSLDNFKREGMMLTGVLHSNGLLPPLEESLTLRNDNSLGFTFKTSQEGLPVYNGRGYFYNELEMSSGGLHGKGQLDYLTSTTYSDDFTFHPDSMMTNSHEFMVRKNSEGTSFPSVNSKNNRIKWFAKKDEFNAYMSDVPFTMFSDTVRLEGDLCLEPGGLSGKGRMDLVTSTVVSRKFVYMDEQFVADSAGFRLNSPLSDKLAINTSDVRANIDFNSKKGTFYSNKNFSNVEFPEILYTSNLDFFEWEMEDEVVKMGLNKADAVSKGEDGLSGPRYFSQLPSQDSLNFVSPLAIYDYKAGELTATSVPYIQVADARIFPGDGQIVVGKNAVMRQLTDATIVADYRFEYHRIIDADVSISGKYDYTASGDYEYVDLTGEVQTIHFNQVTVNDSIETEASGEINASDNFTLSPYFEYQGQAFLAASDPFLRFKGGARLIHDCPLGRQWLKFDSRIDPMNVMIPISEAPLQIDMAPTYAGTMISRDSTHVYSTFISKRKDYFDKLITSADGFLRFDPETERYEIASSERLEDPRLPGNYLALERSSCKVIGSGNINLQLDFGQVKMRTVGEAVHNMSGDDFSTRLMMTLDFLFSQDALKLFANDLDSVPSVKPMELTDPFYRHSLRELVGRAAADRLEADLGLYAEYRNIPSELSKTLVLSDVKLKWNQYTRSYRYEGEIGLVKTGESLVTRKVNAIIEMTKRASGDLLDMYLVLDDNTWYYFGYSPGSMQVVSSNRVFNNLVFELKAKERKMKTRMGDTGYIYSLAPERRLSLFLRRFNAGNEEQINE